MAGPDSSGSHSSSSPTGSFPEAAASSAFAFPFAAAPDIIRATQKDAYFQNVLLEHLSEILRKIYGARALHQYTAEAKALADFLYLSLTTLRGSRTLGEEYCDIVHVDTDTQRLPGLDKRAGYVATVILIPYILTKLLPKFRQRIKQKLDRTIARKQMDLQRQNMMQQAKAKGKEGGMPKKPLGKPTSLKIQEYLRNNLDVLTSTENLLALNLAVFYFSGAYYHVAKRVWGLRYIFTKRLLPHEQRQGYEVLGVLLMAQLATQAYKHIASHIYPEPSASEAAKTNTAASLLPQASGPLITLDDDKKLAFMQGENARNCTLCLSPMTDPTATSCGHIFCWGCIEEWCRSKPECPLCRQGAQVQHLLPLRG